MKQYTILGLFNFLFLTLLGFNAHAQRNLHDYVNLITKVFEQNKESSVTILHFSHYDNVWEANQLFEMTKMLSKRKIMSITADFRDWNEMKRHYFEKTKEKTRVRRPLIVIFITKEKGLTRFHKMSEELRFEERLFYLILFVKTEEQQPLFDFCMKPVGNPFQLRLDASMVVKCYDDNALRIWYTLDGNEMLVRTWAIWHPQTKVLKMTLEGIEKKINLGGKELTIGTVNSSGLTKWKKNGELGGYFGNLLDMLKESMNFTWKLGKKEQDYGSWNTTDKYWTGAMGLLNAREVDLVVSDMAMVSIRTAVVEFTAPLLIVKIILYVQKPKSAMSVKWSGYFKPFSILVWAAILLLILVTPLILTLMEIKMRKSYILSLLLLENYFNVWGIYCQPVWLEFPTASSLRIAYFSIFMSGLIILNYYSAFLVSRLTYPVPDDFLPDMEAFIKEGTYKLAVLKNSADYNFFEFSTTPTLKAMFRLMVQSDNLPETVQAGFDMVCKQKVGFFVSETARLVQGLNIKCSLHEVSTRLHEVNAMALPKDSQYITEINRNLLRFKGNGMLRRLREEYFHHEIIEKRSIIEVTIWEVVVLLAIVTAGIVFGIIILLIEKIIYLHKIIEVKKTKVQAFITSENARKWSNFENQKTNPDRYNKDGDLNIKFLRKDYQHKIVLSPGDKRIQFRL